MARPGFLIARRRSDLLFWCFFGIHKYEPFGWEPGEKWCCRRCLKPKREQTAPLNWDGPV